ncbi:hypothetical protein KR038_003298 [Drosophila bunnanda]|nr:hypothetical protein KR038_003298 [Drosophila bunnanda]
MYLDTKNLTANSGSNSPAAMSTVPAKRMRKVWLPLRRLLTVGGKGRPAPLTLAHPNNVDLNNTQQQQQHQHPQLELLITDESKAAPEESMQKYGLELRQTPREELDDVSLTQPPNTPTLISSVYVEKVSARSCGACQHGRNCQHTHHSSNSSNISSSNINSSNISSSNINSSSNTPQQLPSSVWDLQLPLQYISTDNGTFFWTNSQERVDDDLLHALLCQSFSQLPGTLC